MTLHKMIILGLISMSVYGAEKSPTDFLIESADQICVVVVDSLDGTSGPMGVSTTMLNGKVERSLKGELKKGQAVLVKWTVEDIKQTTNEEKRRQVKVGEKFIIFVKPDIANVGNSKEKSYVLADAWLGFHPDNLSLSNYIVNYLLPKKD